MAVAMFSIVATETSVLTFISIPAYPTDLTGGFSACYWIYYWKSIGICFLSPKYFSNNIVSIYEVIGIILVDQFKNYLQLFFL